MQRNRLGTPHRCIHSVVLLRNSITHATTSPPATTNNNNNALARTYQSLVTQAIDDEKKEVDLTAPLYLALGIAGTGSGLPIVLWDCNPTICVPVSIGAGLYFGLEYRDACDATLANLERQYVDFLLQSSTCGLTEADLRRIVTATLQPAIASRVLVASVLKKSDEQQQ